MVYVRGLRRGLAEVGAYQATPVQTGNKAGLVLARLTVAPALLITSWLAVSFPLLALGSFTPAVTIVTFVPVAAVVLTLGLRAVKPKMDASWWAVGGLVAVVVGLCVFELIMSSQQVVVRRDPASYFQFATWLTKHGSLPIPQSRWAFGGGDHALSFDSPAFYQRGGAVVPQFMAGMPLIGALGGWIGGSTGILWTAPIIGALAVLSFGGVVARLAGARWAAPAALALGLSLPMLMVSRSVYSEPPAMALLFGGLLMTIIACHRYEGSKTNQAILAALGGLALGLGELVRLDALSDVLPVIAFAGLLFALRRGGGIPLFLGLAAGVGAGLAEGYGMSRPYLQLQHSSLVPLYTIGAVVLAGTVVMVGLIRWKGFPDLTRFRAVAFVLPLLIMLGFAVRPYVQTVSRVPHTQDDRANAAFIAHVQRANHMVVNGNRQYSELSLRWVIWYVGLPAVLLATIGAAFLAWRAMRGMDRLWALPYGMIAWATVTALYRPAITPDHPWASRRLIVVVIPGMVLLAFWALDRLAWRGRRHWRLRATVVVAGVALILGPILWTSSKVAFTKTDQGEADQAAAMCRAIGPNASVLTVDAPGATIGDGFTELVRGMCNVPTARMKKKNPDPADTRRVVAKIASAGRRPVVLGATPASLAYYGPARHVFHVNTRQDGRTLVTAPKGTWQFTADIWMATPG